MKKIIFVSFLFTFFFFSFSQVTTRNYFTDPLLAPRDHNVDFKHLKLELSFQPEQKKVSGKATHYFIPLHQRVDSLIMDGINLTVKQILLNGKAVNYRTDSTSISIYFSPSLAWNQQDTLIIAYEVIPRKGLYFIGWNDKTGICRRQIWSQGQGIDNRHWIPMYDEMNDKITTETLVTFDTAYKVLSNGNFLRKTDNQDGTFTWHYKMNKPHAPYLIMLGIGKYEVIESKSSSGVPMYFWYYPDWKDHAEPTYRYSEKIMDFFEKEIGVSYPWETYSQIPVQDFMYGAMENTTATVFGDFIHVDARAYIDRNYVGTNAHELAHQWFGDFVTARSLAHHWLQESFATYYGQLWEREMYGEDFFNWARKNANDQALEESKRNFLPVAHSKAGRVRHYPKGAFILNMLKYVCGKEAYNKAIKFYLEKNKYGNVDSHELLIAFHETLGTDLSWFWDEWIYRGGEPHYKVFFSETVKPEQKKPALHYNYFSEFTVEQVHLQSETVGLFKMPIWFEVHYTDGTSDKKQVWIEKQSHLVSIPNPEQKKIDYVLFDPNSEVLKSVTFEKPFEMLKAQAQKAKHMLDRYDAVYAMRNIPLERKREILFLIYQKETFHAIKSEIIFQFREDDNKQAKAVLKQAAADKDVKVRKALMEKVKYVPEELLPEIEKLLLDSSYEIIDMALEYLAFANPDKIPFYLEQTKRVEGFPGRNVKITWLEIACLTNPKYIDQLVSYTSNAYEFRTRVNAMIALKKLNYLDEQAIEYILDALLSANNRLAGPAADVLKYFYEQLAYRRIIINYVESRNWQPWESQIIKTIVN